MYCFHRHRIAVVLMVCVALTGCAARDYLKGLGGEKDNSDPPTPLVDIKTSVETIEVWSRNTGKGVANKFLRLRPAYRNGHLFVTDIRGNLVCIDAVSGKIVWRHAADLPITGGVGTGDRLVFIGSEEGDVLAFSSDSGDPLWQTRVSSEVLASPQEGNGVVVVRTIDGKVFGLSADDGSRLWNYERTVPPLTLRGTSSPVITGDLAIVGFDGGRIAAIELSSGKIFWETSVSLATGSSQLERMVDIDSDPLVIGNDAYVVAFQGRVASIALESGRISWTRNISSHAGLSSDGTNLYITDDQDHVIALERTTGNLLWEQKNLYARRVTAPAVIRQLVVVGDGDGYLHWMDKTDGQFVARTRIAKQPILAAPFTIEDVVYAYSSNGKLVAYTSN